MSQVKQQRLGRSAAERNHQNGPKTGTGRTSGAGRPASSREVVQTWAFDSVGDRKYALQIQRAKNGNPCLRIVEGVPQGDGTFRKFDLTIWSEDFGALWEAMDEVRAYIEQHGIRTPPGHRYEPSKHRGKRGEV